MGQGRRGERSDRRNCFLLLNFYFILNGNFIKWMKEMTEKEMEEIEEKRKIEGMMITEEGMTIGRVSGGEIEGMMIGGVKEEMIIMNQENGENRYSLPCFQK